MELLTMLLKVGVICYFIYNISTYIVYKTSIYRQIVIYYQSKPAWTKLITNNWYYKCRILGGTT